MLPGPYPCVHANRTEVTRGKAPVASDIHTGPDGLGPIGSDGECNHTTRSEDSRLRAVPDAPRRRVPRVRSAPRRERALALRETDGLSDEQIAARLDVSLEPNGREARRRVASACATSAS